MLGVLLTLSPVFAFGVVALIVQSRGVQLQIANLTRQSPAGLRSKRSRKVDAVVLHQMSFSRGTDPARYHRVKAHFIVLPDGTVAQLHPVSARLSASGGFNSRSVAIEFAGNLKSANGNWWKPNSFGRDSLTSAQVAAGRSLLRLLHREGVRFVFAHRQSDPDRGNDPGPEIWSSVAEWAIKTLEMSDGGPEYRLDGGRVIPEEWRSFHV